MKKASKAIAFAMASAMAVSMAVVADLLLPLPVARQQKIQLLQPGMAAMIRSPMLTRHSTTSLLKRIWM